MRTKTLITLLTITILASVAAAAPPASFEEAKQRAVQRRQPVLLEFSVDGCADCLLSMAAVAQDADVQGSLATLVHYRVDISSDEGRNLADTYHPGGRRPVYIFMDSKGGEISRWSSFHAPQRFIRVVSRATADVTTVQTRMDRHSSSPNLTDALYLANYYMAVSQPAKAAGMYRDADRLNTHAQRDYKFEVFHATASAAWAGEMSFDEAEVAGEAALNAKKWKDINSVRVAVNLSDLARRTGHTDRLKKHLERALETIRRNPNASSDRVRAGMEADLSLYFEHDTAKAIEAKRAGLPMAANRTGADRIDFADYGIMRGINIEESERIVRGEIQAGAPDQLTEARYHYLLSEIEFVKGNVANAISACEKALSIDYGNAIYTGRLEEYRKKL
jgi:tetratricopeptide (TPR) repeat protein